MKENSHERDYNSPAKIEWVSETQDDPDLEKKAQNMKDALDLNNKQIKKENQQNDKEV